MIKGYVKKGVRYFICLFASIWITLLVSLVGVMLVRFAVPKDSILESVLMTVLTTASMIVCMFICAHRIAYNEDSYDIKSVIIPMIVALVIQLVYAAIFSFTIYGVGPANWFGSIIYRAMGNEALGTPSEYVIPWIFLYDIIYIVTVVAGERHGVKKRALDREALVTEAINKKKGI